MTFRRQDGRERVYIESCRSVEELSRRILNSVNNNIEIKYQYRNRFLYDNIKFKLNRFQTHFWTQYFVWPFDAVATP